MNTFEIVCAVLLGIILALMGVLTVHRVSQPATPPPPAPACKYAQFVTPNGKPLSIWYKVCDLPVVGAAT